VELWPILSLTPGPTSLPWQRSIRNHVLSTQNCEKRFRCYSDIQTKNPEGESLSAAISRHQRDVRELEQVEDQIRKLPGLERFQLEPSPADLMNLSEYRLIVSFNATSSRSDAVLVTKANIKASSLPNFQYDDLVTNKAIPIPASKGPGTGK
jgi:hypothetical protein